MSYPIPQSLKASIVVIDDDPHILEVMTLILTRHGYRTYPAATAREGLEMIAGNAPELALLDYMMPETDGLSTLRQIRARFPSTYVVILTGQGNEEIAVELMKGGACEYILKPFNTRNLIERLDKVLHIREIELHNRELQSEQERLLQEIENWNQELQQRVREKTEALQKAHLDVVQSEKLAALGYLSAGMAHEIRNPLNSISLFVQLIRQGSTDPEHLEYLGHILKEIDRIDSIICKLLEASRRTRIISRKVQIDQVIDSALEVFAPQIENGNILVSRRYRLIPPPIKADPTELEQIFTNLFLNALDEMPNGGRLDIEVDVECNKVVVRVGDSGKGIGIEHLPNIFEPFFTTKARSTGMGLPVVQRIVSIYEGSIAVEKTTFAGTTFRLEFPTCR